MDSKLSASTSLKSTRDILSHLCEYLAQLWRACLANTNTTPEENWIPAITLLPDVHIWYNNVHQVTIVALGIEIKN